ncbi:MAG: NADH-quinone oxidoreductase subunit [Candidatus Woesearchaeota archaeon]|nr:NADH-quinone oxidoreductase subunit [Candidatus Woesearchaeota archaeon]MDN5328089.1 NADH-quinone oxidoreductase subunit [Candidatus Woesearchaeota archaeon]
MDLKEDIENLDELFNKVSILEELSQVNKKYGYLPEKVLRQISFERNIPLSKLYGLATFYNQFKLEASGKYVIEVCEGTACHINHSSELKRAVKDVLKIDVNQTTKDKLFTLREVRCLGVCAMAPVCRINNKIYGNLNYNKMKALIKEIMKSEGNHKQE